MATASAYADPAAEERATYEEYGGPTPEERRIANLDDFASEAVELIDSWMPFLSDTDLIVTFGQMVATYEHRRRAAYDLECQADANSY